MFFSVIVPIFRVEKYLKRCVDSVLNQSFLDYELILVDDGSDDNCPAICDEYAKKDNRIKVIHKKNGGLVSARQAGIKLATGDYIINLDSDDALTDNILFNAHRIISETGAEIVDFSYRIYKNDELSEPVNEFIKEGFYNKEDMIKHIYPSILCNPDMKHIFYFLWGKAFKRELITPHQLKVSNSISLGEDLSCLVPCLVDAKSIYISREEAYLYTIRNDSISTTFNTKQLVQISDVIKGLKEIKTDSEINLAKQISRYSCFMCFAILAAAAEGKFFNSIKEIKRLILSLHYDEIKKAEFENITIKSRIGIFLMKKRKIRTAFYFLYLCSILKKGE